MSGRFLIFVELVLAGFGIAVGGAAAVFAAEPVVISASIEQAAVANDNVILAADVGGIQEPAMVPPLVSSANPPASGTYLRHIKDTIVSLGNPSHGPYANLKHMLIDIRANQPGPLAGSAATGGYTTDNLKSEMYGFLTDAILGGNLHGLHTFDSGDLR